VRWSSLACLPLAVLLCACSDETVDPVEPPPVEPDATLEFVDLGTHALDTAVSIDVPADVLGATIVARGEGEFGFFDLVSSDFWYVIEEFGFDGVARFTSKRPLQSPAETTLAAALPQSDIGLLGIADDWILSVLPLPGEAAPTEVALSMWLRHEPPPQSTMQIDVNWFMAEGVASEQHVASVIDTALAGFAGMSVGVVERHALSADAALIDNEEQYAALVAQTSAARRAPALNVIAVADASGLFGSPVGRAGGVPGLCAEHGSELSAVVVELSDDVDADGETLRHETGHMAGLFHTSDATGFDPLADTASCADFATDPASCPDAGNLMFPVATGTARSALSATQERIILGSTLYRVTPTP
jgi:hypothetical protein